MIIVSKWNSDCKPTAKPRLKPRLIEIGRECAGKAGANSAVPVVPVATSNMANKMYKEAKRGLNSSFFHALRELLVLFHFILSAGDRSSLLFGRQGENGAWFFPFYPGKWPFDVLPRWKGCNLYVKRSIVQHTLLSVRNSHSLRSWRY